ncbi:MAG: hypothetical protein DRP09_18310 [Candidatus Thorarchaeota archaeon]|nr:MAG: hypothetical protein DRP09_18310 [Candidatus Thorarchaeota archaeon]
MSKMGKDKWIGVWEKPSDSLKAQVGRWEYHDIELISKNIIEILKITKDDIVLDVCCGNGLITKKIAESCKEIHGVDFSEFLIETAKRKNNGENIYYHCDDALNIDKKFKENTFSKAYCYFSLQHFSYKKGEMLIKVLSKVTNSNGLILIGDIPDIRRIWRFYNTPKKKLSFFIDFISCKIRGVGGWNSLDSMGWWWNPYRIKKICDRMNLKCEILEQDRNLPHAYYRFDVLIKT